MTASGTEEFKVRYIVLIGVALVGLAASLYAGSRTHTPAAPHVPGMAAISEITVVSSANPKPISVAFAYYRGGVNGEKLDFNFKLAYSAGQPALFRIVPDDCLDKLDINGKEVKLTAEASAKRCDWKNGFTMDLKPYLHEGSNAVHMLVRNIGGWTGLNVQPLN